MENKTTILTILSLIALAVFVNLFAGILSGIISAAVLVSVIIYAVYLRNKRIQLVADRNRWKPYYVIGCHPETDNEPYIKRFKEDCIFVDHKDVRVEAKAIRDRIKEAVKGLPDDQVHEVIVHEFTFQDPAGGQQAVNEYFTAEEGENNYPCRISKQIELDRAIIHIKQHDAKPEAYQKIELGQRIEW